MSNGFNVLKKFVKWQQSVNNGFCTHMWLQNPLFTCYHLTKIFWKKFCQMATKFEQWVLYSHVTTKPIVQTFAYAICLTKIFLASQKIYLAGQNFFDLRFYIGFWWFWPAKYILASQNQILAGQNKIGRADGIGICYHLTSFFVKTKKLKWS